MRLPGTQVPVDPLMELSERERELLPLIADGKTNREIALVLSLSENSVKTYVSNILQKLHLARRAEAAAFIVRRGWWRQIER
jgi:two-component system response regulator DevR